ncbi:unnamed protein product [Boreogadus saida]
MPSVEEGGRGGGGRGETLHLSGKYECEAGEVGEKYLSLAKSSPSRENPRVAGPLEPLEKPVSVVLVKNTPYEAAWLTALYANRITRMLWMKAEAVAARDSGILILPSRRKV